MAFFCFIMTQCHTHCGKCQSEREKNKHHPSQNLKTFFFQKYQTIQCFGNLHWLQLFKVWLSKFKGFNLWPHTHTHTQSNTQYSHTIKHTILSHKKHSTHSTLKKNEGLTHTVLHSTHTQKHRTQTNTFSTYSTQNLSV